MSHSTYDCFVITYWMEYMGTSLHDETIYTDHAEAQKECDALLASDSAKRHGIRYVVEKLSSYMSTVREEAHDSGRRAEMGCDY